MGDVNLFGEWNGCPDRWTYGYPNRPNARAGIGMYGRGCGIARAIPHFPFKNRTRGINTFDIADGFKAFLFAFAILACF